MIRDLPTTNELRVTLLPGEVVQTDGSRLFRTRVNGTLTQDGATDDLIFPVPELINIDYAQPEAAARLEDEIRAALGPPRPSGPGL